MNRDIYEKNESEFEEEVKDKSRDIKNDEISDLEENKPEVEILEPERDSNYLEKEEEKAEDPLQKQLDELKDRHIRLQADFQNFKRRANNEKAEYLNLGVQKLANDLLPVLDTFERAIEACDDKDAFYEGIVLIEGQLIDTLKKHDIVEIEALNKPFDPNFHHAVIMDEREDCEPGIVTEVLQKGYMIGNKVLRPSMVKVSK